MVAADGAETGARDDGGVRQAAALVPDEGIGSLEQLLRQSRARHEVAHQDKQGDHR
jgi:hypothetical protein